MVDAGCVAALTRRWDEVQETQLMLHDPRGAPASHEGYLDAL